MTDGSGSGTTTGTDAGMGSTGTDAGTGSTGSSGPPPAGWYGAHYVAQSFPLSEVGSLTIPNGGDVTVWLEMRNTGSRDWDSNTELALTGPRDRRSAVQGADWVAYNRPARVSGTVPPGGTYRFQFTVHGAVPGDYDEHFGVVEDGVAWFSDSGQLGPADDVLEGKFHVDSGPVMPAADDAGVPPAADDAGVPPVADDAGVPPAADDAGPAPTTGDGGLGSCDSDGGYASILSPFSASGETGVHAGGLAGGCSVGAPGGSAGGTAGGAGLMMLFGLAALIRRRRRRV